MKVGDKFIYIEDQFSIIKSGVFTLKEIVGNWYISHERGMCFLRKEIVQYNKLNRKLYKKVLDTTN